MKKLFYFLTLALCGFILLNCESVIRYTQEATVMCYEFIIPSLFPFFVCSGLLVYSGFGEIIAKVCERFMRPLFNVPPSGAIAFVLGIISGFPSGAIYTAELYKSSNLSKTEAERLLAFCNNCGPLFIIGTVATALCITPKAGILLYLIHIASSVVVGLIFRNYRKDRHISPKTRVNTKEISITEAISRALTNASQNIISVCFSIIFFSAISRALLDLLSLSPKAYALFSGLAEFSTGVLNVSGLDIPDASKLIYASFIVGFSGFCVHLQFMRFAADAGLSLMPYILGKCLHAITAAVLTAACIFILPIRNMSFDSHTASVSFIVSSGAIAGACILVIVLSLIFLLPRLQDRASHIHKEVLR